jgi:hypothetical protein
VQSETGKRGEPRRLREIGGLKEAEGRKEGRRRHFCERRRAGHRIGRTREADKRGSHMVRGGGLTLIELKKDSQTKQNKGRVKYGDYSLHFGGLVDDEQLEDGAGQREKGGPR